eukprot:757413-Hanusia_phi.AAC.4
MSAFPRYDAPQNGACCAHGQETPPKHSISEFPVLTTGGWSPLPTSVYPTTSWRNPSNRITTPTP